MLVDIFRLTNEELIRHTEELAADLRTKTCDLVESLAEFDRRKLYQDFNYTSLFEYCIYKLKMSDAAAYRRIRAARAFQSYPPVKPLLRAGKLTLESLALLHPFLNDADAGKLVAEASGKRIWEVDRLVAGRRTEPPRRDVVRFVPPMALKVTPPDPADEIPLLAAAPETALVAATDACPRASLFSSEPAPNAAMETLPHAPLQAPEPPSAPPPSAPPPPARSPKQAPGVRIAFTADAGFFKLLKEAQAAMRHKYPSGRLDGVFRDALESLLRKTRPWAS